MRRERCPISGAIYQDIGDGVVRVEKPAGGGHLFKPEYTRDVEVGAKSQWSPFNLPGHTLATIIPEMEVPIGNPCGAIKFTLFEYNFAPPKQTAKRGPVAKNTALTR